MVEAAAKTIVFIDYFANFVIANQTKLITSNIDKLNLRLMRAFIYLSQFQMNIRHRSNKQHVIFDALFRLSTISFAKSVIEVDDTRTLNLEIYHGGLKNFERSNQTYVYHGTLVIMSNEFKIAILTEYQKKPI